MVARSTSTDRRLCVAVDMQGYGRRAGRQHTDIQQNLVSLIADAASCVGLDHDTWDTQRSGDGELSVLPTGQREELLVDDFVRELNTGLRRVNEGRKADWCIRLRLAIHHGPAWRAANGFAGSAPVTVGRLLNSDQLRQALHASDETFLAVMLSRQVYEDTVVAAHTSLEPTDFVPVRVRAKESDHVGWVRVPGLAPSVLKRVFGKKAAAAEGRKDAAAADGRGRPRQAATADSEGRVQQAGRDLTGARYGGGEGPTYVNHTTFEEGVTVDRGVIGFNFGGERNG